MKNVIKKPHISEKSTKMMQEENSYVFVVEKDANKIEIKKAVQELYSVDVVNVNVVSIPAKKRRLGRTEGEKPGYKKAIVKIGEDQNIEIFSA